MKNLKYISVILALFGYFFCLQSQPIHAQDTNPTPPTEKPAIGFNSECLTAIHDPDDVHGAFLSFPDAAEREKRNIQTLPKPDKQTWFFVCITKNDTHCTTGNPDEDMKIFGKRDDYDYLASVKDPFRAVDIGGATNSSNPTMSSADAEPRLVSNDGKEVHWHDEYLPEVSHRWQWLQYADPPEGGEGEAGGMGALQNATFPMEKAKGNNQKCADISWDPKGFVLDAQTLYPVRGVAITISKKGADGIFTDMASKVGLSNPDVSQQKTGQYSFYTPPGVYKLRVTSTNATMVDVSAMNPSYKSVFTLSNPISTIYKAGQEIIEQAGKVAVSHIPVTVTSDSMLVKDLAVSWRNVERSPGQDLYFSGAVSHPRSIVKVVATYVDKDGVTSQETTTELTDEIGEYGFSIPQTKITPQTKLSDSKTIFLIRYDATLSLNPEIYPNPGLISPELSFSGEVIPTYIDGIAYDERNQPLVAGTVVGVYPSYSEKAMAYAVTDTSGRFMIGSQHIPQVPYTLRYRKSTGEVIKVSTSTFIKQNAAFFVANEIMPFNQRPTTQAEEKSAYTSLMKVTGNKIPDMRLVSGANKNGSSSSSKNGSRISGDQQDVEAAANSSKGVAGMPGVIMIVVVILILIMLGVGAFVMMKSKQTAQPKI